MKNKENSFLIYAVVFVSGMAALIYQVAWHRYLGILLGAQAKATAIILAIFLGGIAAGYLTFGYWTRTRRWNLLTAYSIVEVMLAFWGLFFPLMFVGMQKVSLSLYANWGVEFTGIDFLVSMALLFFPTFLMGGTLPLLTQGLSEDVRSASRTHARIYGWNTVGSCFGALLAGYFLIPQTDLPVTVTTAALMNTLVAGVVYFVFAKGAAKSKKARALKAARSLPVLNLRVVTLFVVAFLSGFYVLTLENVFIRLMGLSTGSSSYTFTLVVAIFVLALGLGSLMVRRIGEFSEKHLLWNQLGVASALLFLYWTVDFWPYWNHLLRIVFRDLPSNFFVYQAALGVGFLGLLIVPLAICGFTLPLCFHLLKDKQETLGERVGQLYGFNTVGCVLGALGGYGLLHWMNLDHLFRFCILLSLLGATVALYTVWSQKQIQGRPLVAVFSALVLVLMGVGFAPDFDKRMYVQVFRKQAPTPDSFKGRKAFAEAAAKSGTYLVYEDGPNTSVGITHSFDRNRKEVSRSLLVNGKSDGNTMGDRLTMNLTGNIPGMLAPRLDKVCVIGFGTGVTAGELATYRESRSVDIVEIAGTIIEHADRFDAYNRNVTKNPKVRFHEMDAFRFLAGQSKYDVIVSEPSNPWVAGVENLYTEEFYRTVRRSLNERGLFMQWVQLYSFNNQLLGSVFATIQSQFPYVRAFKMMDSDVALVASQHPITAEDLAVSQARWRANPEVVEGLTELGIADFDTLLAFELLPAAIMPHIARSVQPLTLDTPRLNHRAAIAHFTGGVAEILDSRKSVFGYAPSMRDSLLSIRLQGKTPTFEMADRFRKAFCEPTSARSLGLCVEAVAYIKFLRPDLAMEAAYPSLLDGATARGLALLPAPGKVASGPLKKADVEAIHDAIRVYRRLYSSIAPLPIDGLEARLDACLKNNRSDQRLVGECLVEKISLVEFSEPHSDKWMQVASDYMNWFKGLPQDAPDHGVFKDIERALKAKAGERSLSSVRPSRG